MHITRNSTATMAGPSDWFTGAVYVDTVASPTAPSRAAAAMVHFTPGSRTAWHTHPFGQTIFVIEGIGRCQRRGGPIEEIRPGDRVFLSRARTIGTAPLPIASWRTWRYRRSMSPAARSPGVRTSPTRSTRPPTEQRWSR